MRKPSVAILIICCVMLSLSASAQQVILPIVPAQVEVPDAVYGPILTPDNLAANESFIIQKGGTLTAWQQEFKEKGILVKAYDDANSRVLVISAVSDGDAQRFGDIDQHTPETRAGYRWEHLKEGPFVDAGYKADSVEWRNFPVLGRYLMIRYAYRPGGELQHRGFMRRSVKNGLTVTVDMQVYGRGLKGGDNTALNTIFDSLQFTGAVAEGVSVTVFLNETATAPKETNQSNFVLKGTTKAGTVLQAVVMSFETNKPEVFRSEADAKGNYSLEIALGAEGIYLITLTATADGMEPLEKAYSVTYAKDLLPVEMTSELPAVLTQNSYKIAGKTEAGVTVQMILNDKNTTRKTNNSKTFSFNAPTAQDGTYKLRLSFSKAGLATRVFDYEGVKGAPTLVMATEAPTIVDTSEALSPNYTDLIAKAEEYEGKSLTYDGYVTGVQESADGYVVSLALRKATGGYADTLLLISAADPAIAVDSKVRVLGVLEGLNAGAEGAAGAGYPRLALGSIELLEQETPAQAN